MLLRELLGILVSERELDKETIGQYRRSVDRFLMFLGEEAKCGQLCYESVNGYLEWLKKRFDLGPVSIRNHRTGLCRVWQYGVMLGVAPDFAMARVRRPRVQPKLVRAWSIRELNILLKTARGMRGVCKCGIPASELLVAWILVGYETGLRPGDLRRLTWDHVDLELNTVTIAQHKTGNMHLSVIGPESAAALKILFDYEMNDVFPTGKSGMRRWELKLFRDAAKHGFRRSKRQGLGVLRKSHATEIAREHGVGTAAQSLGHKSGTKTAIDHYIDPRVLIATRKLPGSLDQ